MKKLAIMALALISFSGMAQQKEQKKMERSQVSELRKELTPQDRADLQTKKLTLKLDLTADQQAKVHSLILSKSEEIQKRREERKASSNTEKEKLTKDELVKRRSDKLDERIEMKRKMKAILSPEQYAKFENMLSKKNKMKRKHQPKAVKKTQQ